MLHLCENNKLNETHTFFFDIAIEKFVRTGTLFVRTGTRLIGGRRTTVHVPCL